MLSPEHVRVRRRGDELKLQGLSGELRERAVGLARLAAETAREHVGKTRDELARAWAGIECAPRERRLFAGLVKLVEDESEFEMPEGPDPQALRSEVFLAAAERRRAAEPGAFDRQALLGEVAARHGLDAAALELALFADLRGAHRLVRTHAPDPERLVDRYEEAQVQAVLLRATRIVARVRCGDPDEYKELFRKLKFRRLLHRVTELEGGGYQIEIDGPFSLFQGVAKYGLELALTLPALEACASLDLVADVRWSDRGRPLTFRHQGGRRTAPAPVELRSEVEELIRALGELDAGWEVRSADRILDLPGVGVCVPDVVLRRRTDGAEVLVEVLGYWSRDSVWKRVELVRGGLGARILFAASSRLRVSEEVLDESESAALYVYKGRINPQGLLRKAAALAP